jgi:predicted nucleic acid-binding protein
MTKVIIDTSAWIDFFRNKTGQVGDAVATMIAEETAVITGPIVSELLQGLRNRQEGKFLSELLSVVPFAEVIRNDWDETGSLLGKLRRRGITVPLTDALIAVVAKRYGYNILTLDRHFEHLEVPVYPLRN